MHTPLRLKPLILMCDLDVMSLDVAYCIVPYLDRTLVIDNFEEKMDIT